LRPSSPSAAARWRPDRLPLGQSLPPGRPRLLPLPRRRCPILLLLLLLPLALRRQLLPLRCQLVPLRHL
jgi:hypothetical protein